MSANCNGCRKLPMTWFENVVYDQLTDYVGANVGLCGTA
jgi:hypothetical protein